MTYRRHPGSGLFLVIEGPEGSGKSTLAALLTERLRETGLDPVVVREPGGTAVAEGVRKILLDPVHSVAPLAELFLFLAARADLVSQVIMPALEQGRVVLADRFALSTEVYQIDGRGLDADLVTAANEAAVGGALPDLTLVLDLEADEGLERQRQGDLARDRLDQETAEFHRRVVQGYRRRAGDAIVHLDARGSVAEVADQAWREISQRYAEVVPPLGSRQADG